MDAVEFLRERRRMCNAQDNCGTCPIGIVCDDYFVNHNYSQEKASGMVSTVEQWAAEHPVKTRQSVFLEQFPNAPIYTNTHNVALDPCLVDTTLRGHCPTGRGCDICRREFWLTEVEE